MAGFCKSLFNEGRLLVRDGSTALCLAGPSYEAYEVSDGNVTTFSFIALQGVSRAAFSRAVLLKAMDM